MPHAIQIKLTPEDYERVMKAAAEAHLKAATFIRCCVLDKLDAKDNRDDQAKFAY